MEALWKSVPMAPDAAMVAAATTRLLYLGVAASEAIVRDALASAIAHAPAQPAEQFNHREAEQQAVEREDKLEIIHQSMPQDDGRIARYASTPGAPPTITPCVSSQ